MAHLSPSEIEGTGALSRVKGIMDGLLSRHFYKYFFKFSSMLFLFVLFLCWHTTKRQSFDWLDDYCSIMLVVAYELSYLVRALWIERM